MRWSIVLLAATSAFLCFPQYASADVALARQYFEAGKKLRDQGDCARAIPKFEQSLAADESVGGYYNLGYCHEALAHRQEAYDSYKRGQQLASAKKDDLRHRELSGALAALLETPHIRLVLPEPLPEGIQIHVDGQLVDDAFYANETIVFTSDEPTHTVVVSAPGFEERRVTMETKSVRPIELHRPVPKVPAPARTEAPRRWTWQHWTGVGLAGAGVVTGGVLLYFFLDYLPERSRLDRELSRHPCGTDALCGAGEAGDNPATPNVLEADPMARESARSLRQRNNNLEDDINVKAITLGTVAGAILVAGGLVYF
ncbi:MAG TPA: hypothetical protein VM580_13715, partial [Labilithrix sp.]|nr:hypothetical protein [Labilithrix sp.]